MKNKQMWQNKKDNLDNLIEFFCFVAFLMIGALGHPVIFIPLFFVWLFLLIFICYKSKGRKS
jgi:predicted Kef-type K+ transport protein